MKPIAVLLLLLFVPQVTAGQDCVYSDSSAVSDKLSADGYYPLAVGNTWEYEIRSDSAVVAIERNEIVGYAFFKEIFYYRLDTRLYSVSDSIIANGVQTDYVRSTDSTFVRNGSVAPLAVDLKFNASFYSCYWGAYPDSDSSLVTVSVADSSQYSFDEAGGTIEVPLPAIKRYSVSTDTSAQFGHGIGLLTTTGRQSRRLVHTVIDGVPYGTPLAERYSIPVGLTAVDPQVPTSIGVFPNPATSEATVFIKSPTSGRRLDLLLVDATGRTHMSVRIHTGSETVGLDVSELASGVYFIVGAGARPVPLVIAR